MSASKSRSTNTPSAIRTPAADDEALHLPRPAKQERVHRILAAAGKYVDGGENRQIRAPARLEHPKIGSPQQIRAPSRPQRERIERRHTLGPVPHPAKQQRLAQLAQHMPGIIRRAAIHANAHLGASRTQIVDPADAAAQPHVCMRAVRHAHPPRTQPGHFLVVEMDAVREPHSFEIPTALRKIRPSGRAPKCSHE